MSILVNPHTFTLFAIFSALMVPTLVFNELFAAANTATYNFWGLRDIENTYLVT